MQVPGYLVSMYVATCGQNASGLGSDEKDIILLVYVVIEVSTSKIVGIKQYLVRPTGRPFQQQQQQQIHNNNSNIHNSSDSISQTIIPQINLNNNINNNLSNLNNVNNNTLAICDGQTSPIATPIENSELPIAAALSAGKPLKDAIDEFDVYIRSLLDSSLVSTDNLNFKLITDGQLPIRQCLLPEACAKDIELPAYYCKFSDLRKEYVRFKSQDLSRALVPVKDIKKLTQMPALPSLPTSIGEMVKEFELQPYEENDFYVKESRDMVNVILALLSTGHKFEANEVVNLQLEPGICSIDDEIDGSCIVRARGLPWQSSDQDIAKFFRGLNVAKGGVALCLSPLGRRNGEALVRFISQEHRDMALKRHKNHIGNRYIEVYRGTGEDFLSVAGGASNEAQAFLSKGAQVIIRMRGLPYDCSAKQVLDFFTTGENPVDVLDGVDGVLFVKKPDGRATGDAFVLFANESDAPHALSRHRESIGQRYIELFRSTTAEVQQVLNRSMDPKTYEQNNQPLIAQLPPPVQLPLLPQHYITSGTRKNCIRLRGLPYEARVEDILHFLDSFSKNIIVQGVHMVLNPQGQPSGEAFIQMDSEESARLCAQQKHNQFMVFGKKYRYIEVFQCCGDDMNLVLTGGVQSSVVNATKPALLSPGMLPQAQQAPAQAISLPQLPPPHIPQHQPPPNSTNNLIAAASHSHYPVVSRALLAAASHHSHQPTFTSPTTASIPHLTFSNQHPSVLNIAGATSALQHHAHQLHLQNLVAANSANSGGPPPLTLSIPPPPTTNPALLAQQQAHFIAQQSLIARQNAAAAAAAHNEQLFILPPPPHMLSANSASHHLGLTSHGAPNFSLAPQQQLFFMPRPYLPSMSPLAFMPPGAMNPFQSMVNPTATATSGAGMQLSNSVKRTYENAFQQEPGAASAPKRQLTRPPSTGNIYGGTLIGPPFGFPHFGPPAAIFSPTPPHHRSNHHTAAYYQPQLVYWPYPSPPVSPTAYYGPPPPNGSHHPQHITSNLAPPHHQQALFPVDYMPYQHHTQHSHQSYHQQAPTTLSSSPINNSSSSQTSVIKTSAIQSTGSHQQSSPQQSHQSQQFPVNSTATPSSPSINSAQFHSVTSIPTSPTVLSPVSFETPNGGANLYIPSTPGTIVHSPSSPQHMLTVDTKTSNLAGPPLEYPYPTYPQPYNGRILSPTPGATANSYNFNQSQQSSFSAGSVYSPNHYVELYIT